MNIERDIIQALVKWKHSDFRKPLILQGARHFGKTWVLKQFVRIYFDSVAYFNFDEKY